MIVEAGSCMVPPNCHEVIRRLLTYMLPREKKLKKLKKPQAGRIKSE